MKKTSIVILLVVALMLVIGCQGANNAGDNGGGNEAAEKATSIILATTTSTYDSGLLQELLPEFEAKHNIEVDVVSVGTGQAIEIGERGDADIILVHARNLEDKFVEEGHGTERWDVMYNDFVLLGPVGDPGDIYSSANVTEAFQKMRNHMETEGVTFQSRGDNSGTHNKEKSIWPMVGIDDFESQEWYNSLGQGMGNTLIATNEMQGYTLTDRGTYLAMMDNLPNLEIVFEGDDILFNPYGIIPVNPDKNPNINHEAAMLLVEFFISPETQEKIGEFGKDVYGQSLFFPNAK